MGGGGEGAKGVGQGGYGFEVWGWEEELCRMGRRGMQRGCGVGSQGGGTVEVLSTGGGMGKGGEAGKGFGGRNSKGAV